MFHLEQGIHLESGQELMASRTDGEHPPYRVFRLRAQNKSPRNRKHGRAQKAYSRMKIRGHVGSRHLSKKVLGKARVSRTTGNRDCRSLCDYIQSYGMYVWLIGHMPGLGEMTVLVDHPEFTRRGR